MFKVLITFSFVIFPALSSAQEGCFGAGLPLLHCSAKGGAKTLDICLQGDVGYYRFGPTDGPAELILTQKVQDIHLTPWNGVGNSIYEELEFWAGDITYQVFFAQDRIAAETPELRGGVTVFKADQTLAQLECDKDRSYRGTSTPCLKPKNAPANAMTTAVSRGAAAEQPLATC